MKHDAALGVADDEAAAIGTERETPNRGAGYFAAVQPIRGCGVPDEPTAIGAARGQPLAERVEGKRGNVCLQAEKPPAEGARFPVPQVDREIGPAGIGVRTEPGR